MSRVESRITSIDGRRVHYRHAGPDDAEVATVLLHGWPASSYLWRNIMPAFGSEHRVIAPDLLGFGHSEKRLDDSYSFGFHARMLSGLFDELGVRRVHLVLHDLGGPIGLYWAVENLDRVERIALLNTVVYVQFTWTLSAFLLSTVTPGLRMALVSRPGLKFAMEFGVVDKSCLSEEAIEEYQAPFGGRESRKVLLKTARSLSFRTMAEVGKRLTEFRGPMRVIYAENDRILPDVGKTMARIQQEFPRAEVTRLPGCGHFLQEEAPEHVGQLLAEFID